MNKLFILDLGSGNTCQNNATYIKTMISKLSKVDKERRFILKWQLFKKAGDNIPLEFDKFKIAYECAEKLGYKTTASVFDIESLQFLCEFKIPFIKIANDKELYSLIQYVPDEIPVIASMADKSMSLLGKLAFASKMCCVSDYPAKAEDYVKRFTLAQLYYGISDHTETWDLFEKYTPKIYECHYCLPDSTGPDALSFARRPNDLKYILTKLGEKE
jgi:sialic acid synthase SpsE